MINRYESLTTRTLADGRIVYASLRPSSVPRTVTGIDIIAKSGDRLDNLAARYYGKASLWWIIAKANDIIDETMHVAPGTQLHIPAPNEL